MGRFTKRVIMGLTAALTLAGGAFAGSYLITNFDNGTNQHNMGFYYYYYAAGDETTCNATEIAQLDGVGPMDESGPVTYIAQGTDDGTPCKSGTYCGALMIKTLPPHVATDDYYPSFGFGISLTKDDDTKYGTDFNKVETIKFWAKTTTPGLTALFKFETIETSPHSKIDGNDYDFLPNCKVKNDNLWLNKSGDYSNSYMVAFQPTGEWTEFSYDIKNIVKGSGSGKIEGAASTAPAKGFGYIVASAKDTIMQDGHWGYHFEFKRENVTKIAWAINSNVAGVAGGPAKLFIDDVSLVGSEVDENFYVAPWNGTKYVSSALGAPTPHKVLSTFEGNDATGSTTDYLKNSREYYWYSYTDNVGGGFSRIIGLIENPHIPGNMIMNTDGNGQGGGRGASILFETADEYKQGEKSVMAFVGIGANLYHDTTSTQYLNADAFEGIYFEYWTSWGPTETYKVSVELTDMCDAQIVGGSFEQGGQPIVDTDGESFFTQVPGTNEQWRAAKIPFDGLVLPGWTKKGGARRGGANPSCPETLDKTRLAALKFKVEGKEIIEQRLKIDNVAFYGAAEWGEGVSTKFAAGSKAKAVGLRATYNRGVVGVNWSAAQNIASGKVSLVNMKGRTVASAPLVKAAGKVTANLGKGTVPTGMYFVRVNAKDIQGKKVVQQVPLTIVK